jgi:hypothetical protein
VAYADSPKRDFYKLRVDFDVSNRTNFSGLKSDTLTFLPLFSKDFTGANIPGVFPTFDGWHKMKIEIRNTTATQTTIWCYFDGTLLKNSPGVRIAIDNQWVDFDYALVDYEDLGQVSRLSLELRF